MADNETIHWFDVAIQQQLYFYETMNFLSYVHVPQFGSSQQTANIGNRPQTIDRLTPLPPTALPHQRLLKLSAQPNTALQIAAKR